MAWNYWRTKGEDDDGWSGLVEAYKDSSPIVWAFYPEIERWCYPQEAPSPEEVVREFESNRYWVRTNRLEYLIKQKMALPEPPESI